MTNYEKYKDRIDTSLSPCELVKGLRGCTAECFEIDCDVCEKANYKWVTREYIEPEIDWSKVEQGRTIYNKEGFVIGNFIGLYDGYIIASVKRLGNGDLVVDSYTAEECRLER